MKLSAESSFFFKWFSIILYVWILLSFLFEDSFYTVQISEWLLFCWLIVLGFAVFKRFFFLDDVFLNENKSIEIDGKFYDLQKDIVDIKVMAFGFPMVYRIRLKKNEKMVFSYFLPSRSFDEDLSDSKCIDGFRESAELLKSKFL